jgi:parvulin-like peptidyl-prolyl isomerase
MLIDQELILEAYEEQEGRIPEWAIDQRIAEIVHERFEGNRGALMNALAEDQVTYDEWRVKVRERLIVASMHRENVHKHIVVSANDVHDYYTANSNALEQPGEVRLSMIVIPRSASASATNTPLEQARSVRVELRDGAEFADLARRYSRGPKARDGGQWDWQPLDDLRPELKEAILALDVNDVSDIIETEGQFYLLRLDARRGGKIPPFDKVREEIEKKLRNMEGERLYKDWRASLRRNAFIKRINEDPYAK